MSSTPASEENAPYNAQETTTLSPREEPTSHTPSVFDNVRKIRTVHLNAAKAAGEKFAMLTCYDYLTAQIFDAAGIELLLVGDSASNNVLGYESTLAITVDEMIPLVAAVSRGAQRSMVVADLPFGSYQASPAQAVETASRFMKEGGAHAIKMEASSAYAEHVKAITQAGIPVMAHIGFTPQSEHALGGFRIQGRGDSREKILHDALTLTEAGAFCLLMEMVTEDVAEAVNKAVGDTPTIGIGAGSSTTGQVLVWQDAFGLRQGKMARFVKQYAHIAEELTDAAKTYRQEVRDGTYPGPEHIFKNS
ncbi:3-methyl-2-oxobutanoate hydroxymethyltransferase [Rothia sp. P7181]|uniref:3-methyl-2-oxobutanoate hydroxymethyltransferase n=1 Tax=unclassified Rothia (in: high G+C Gram-positive bacteria) TaxID=2689056 RepID=UPI003AD55A05